MHNLLEIGLGSNSTQKLRFLLTLTRHLTSQHMQQMGDGGPQQIGPGFDTKLEIGLGPNLTQKLAQELRFSPL
jgi:hypothetical protein